MLRELSREELISIRKKDNIFCNDVISDEVKEKKELIKQVENPECIGELKWFRYNKFKEIIQKT